jgi:hypothetical protein
MNEIILDNPYTITTVSTYSKFIIKDIKIILDVSARINVLLKSNDTKTPPIIKVFLLEGDDYANWGNDDTYLVNYIKNILLDNHDNHY